MEDRIEVPQGLVPGLGGQVVAGLVPGHPLLRPGALPDGRQRRRGLGHRAARAACSGLGVDTWDSISAKVAFDNGATVAFDTSWILPDEFEAVVNQGIRLVGTWACWSATARTAARSPAAPMTKPGMQTHNKSFLRQKFDKQGREIFEGYGMESIADFAYNLNVLLDGGKIADLGAYPPAGRHGGHEDRRGRPQEPGDRRHWLELSPDNS